MLFLEFVFFAFFSLECVCQLLYILEKSVKLEDAKGEHKRGKTTFGTPDRKVSNKFFTRRA